MNVSSKTDQFADKMLLWHDSAFFISFGYHLPPTSWVNNINRLKLHILNV